jgi:hypothetical protein
MHWYVCVCVCVCVLLYIYTTQTVYIYYIYATQTVDIQYICFTDYFRERFSPHHKFSKVSALCRYTKPHSRDYFVECTHQSMHTHAAYVLYMYIHRALTFKNLWSGETRISVPFWVLLGIVALLLRVLLRCFV